MTNTTRILEFENRRRAARLELESIGAHALVTDRPEHVRYLTGYPVASVGGRPVIAVLLSTEELIVIAGGQVAGSIARDLPFAQVETYTAPILSPPGMILPDGQLQFAPAALELLRSVLEDKAVGRVAVDGLNATFPGSTKLDAVLSGMDVVAGSDLMWTLRRRKTSWEIEQLRTAASNVERAFELTVPQLKPGMTEIEIARRMAVAVLESGAGLYFATAAVVEDGREILGHETDRVWGPGELLCIDAGSSVEGYTSDFCRTYVAGEPSAHQASSYQRVLDARDAAVAAFRPGMTAGQLASEMVAVLGNSPEEVAGRMGHGLGLGLEPPALNPADPTVLDEGVVFCLEPAIVIDGTYYTLEEEYAVSSEGLVLLSPPAPRELIPL